MTRGRAAPGAVERARDPRRARADVAGAHAGAAAPRPVRLACAAAPRRPQRPRRRRDRRAVPPPLARRRATCAGRQSDVALLDDAREVLGPRAAQERPDRRGRRDPHVRPHRRRRGAGPHADAAARWSPGARSTGRSRSSATSPRPPAPWAPIGWDDVTAPPARQAARRGSSACRSAIASRRRSCSSPIGSCAPRRPTCGRRSGPRGRRACRGS